MPVLKVNPLTLPLVARRTTWSKNKCRALIHFIITFCFCIDAAHTQSRFYISFCIHAADTHSSFMHLTHSLDLTSFSALSFATGSVGNGITWEIVTEYELCASSSASCSTETPNYLVAAFTFATASVFERLRKHKWHVNFDKVS